MKDPCLECVLKHLGDAAVCHEEALLGYPEHMADVLGHLDQAAIEIVGKLPELADAIRGHRKDLTVKLVDGDWQHNVPYRALFEYVLSCAQLESNAGFDGSFPELPASLAP